MSNYSLEIFNEWISFFHDNAFKSVVDFMGEPYKQSRKNPFSDPWKVDDVYFISEDKKSIGLRKYNDKDMLYFYGFDFTMPTMISKSSKYKGMKNAGIARTYYYNKIQITSFIQDYEKEYGPVLFLDEEEKLMLQFELELKLK